MSEKSDLTPDQIIRDLIKRAEVINKGDLNEDDLRERTQIQMRIGMLKRQINSSKSRTADSDCMPVYSILK